MLIYYFELKKAAFWFIDFQQPSLGDIQIPMGLCSLPSPFVRRGGREDLLFFTQRRGAYHPEALRPTYRRQASRLCEHTLFFEN